MDNIQLGSLYKTRNGNHVRILTIKSDITEQYPIVGKVLRQGQGFTFFNDIMLFTNKGQLDIDCESGWDLIEELSHLNYTR